MPVFARLSRRFYEVVGEDVAQQLVDWLNEVERELTRRAMFRSYNELNRARLRTRQLAFRSRLPQSLPPVRAPVFKEVIDLKAEVRRLRSDLIWWMFLYCFSTLLGTLVLVLALR
jgi:hypothetical protein